MVINNNVIKADSGKYLKYNSELASELALGKRFVCKDGKTVLVDISLNDVEEVYPVKIDNAEYFISATNYNDAVTQLIRTKYSLDKELALYANFCIGKNADEMADYQEWRTICKETAKKLF